MTDKKLVRVGFIGAGEVNFGSEVHVVPWNHAKRLDIIAKKLASSVEFEVVGISDVNLQRAASTLKIWQDKTPLFAKGKAYSSYQQMIEEGKPDCVLIGVPPFAHGSPHVPNNIEVYCAEKKVHMFIEKPITLVSPTDLAIVNAAVKKSDVIASVGYMFRYSKAMDKILEIIGDRSKIKTILLRYNSAYTAIAKSMWWDVRLSGGPIVEQSTHFVDIARYLGGEILNDSIQSYSLRCDLSKIPIDVVSGKSVEEGVEEQNKISHTTVAIWKFASGALGSFTHAALLQGDKYECEIEIWGDGVRLILEDPYNLCRLRVRTPESEKEDVILFTDDDPYENELDAFIKSILEGKKEYVRSLYEDAVKTYEVTWLIRENAKTSKI